MTGEKGQDAVIPNWKTYVYKLSDSKPSKPTGNSPSPSEWEDYPTTSGNWWQCIGTVNGETGLVTEWSEVIPVNGRDGQAQDGKFTEFRFAVNTSNSNPPTLNATVRTPSGWSVVPPEKSKDGYLWMTTATINPDDTLNTNWTAPVVISGEMVRMVQTEFLELQEKMEKLHIFILNILLLPTLLLQVKWLKLQVHILELM